MSQSHMTSLGAPERENDSDGLKSSLKSSSNSFSKLIVHFQPNPFLHLPTRWYSSAKMGVLYPTVLGDQEAPEGTGDLNLFIST